MARAFESRRHEPRSVIVNVRLTPAEAAALDAIAKRAGGGCRRSDVIRDALADFASNNGKAKRK